jgi:prevent-host-death family protein
LTRWLPVATYGDMNINAKEAKNRFSELLTRAESGETVIVTRFGKPIASLTPYLSPKKGLNFAAMREYKKARGIERMVDFIPADFDDPLPEDFLIKPIPY